MQVAAQDLFSIESLKIPSGFLDAASAYAAKGWPVLPLHARRKNPLTVHGVKDASTNQEKIQSWWNRHPTANIGLAIPAGYLVLDLDADDARHQLRALDLRLPSTVTATTGRGMHLWYSTGTIRARTRTAILPKVDVRAPGSYVVVPPSIHPSGATYTWSVPLDAASISECPEWIFDHTVSQKIDGPHSTDSWVRRISEEVVEGRRNEALAQVTGLLLRKLDAELAAELAICWATVKLRPALPETEVLRTIDSIAGCELRRQGTI